MARAAIADILRARGVFASAFASAGEVPSGRFDCAVTSDPSVGVNPQVVITSPLDKRQYPIQVSRPVAERELLDAVGEAFGLTALTTEAKEDVTLRAMTSQRILLVEDNEANATFSPKRAAWHRSRPRPTAVCPRFAKLTRGVLRRNISPFPSVASTGIRRRAAFRSVAVRRSSV
jgi:hypothetical protein